MALSPAKHRTDSVSKILRSLRLRRSRTLELLLIHFKSNPDAEYRAAELLRILDLEPGALHPVLDKLVTGGVLAVNLEGSGPRPAKFKSYSLTERGALFGDRYFAGSGSTLALSGSGPTGI